LGGTRLYLRQHAGKALGEQGFIYANMRGRPWGNKALSTPTCGEGPGGIRLYLRQHAGKALGSRGMPSKGPGLCTWHMQLYQRFYAGKDLVALFPIPLCHCSVAAFGYYCCIPIWCVTAVSLHFCCYHSFPICSVTAVSLHLASITRSS
jgi:hypothetical protein